ncbi:MAG: hypothetical protein K0M50_04120 [Prolixibacteraceae bacterium]|nr:hypothetical protein [Prolixibacteraceae bacterium]
MNCIYCDAQQPDRGFFCPSCFKQTKCKHCSELLLKDAKICVFCGEAVGQKTAVTNLNTIEFSETETERKFKASFTDTVGQSISDSFGMILTNKMGSRKHIPASLPFQNSNQQNNEITEEDVENVDESPIDIYPKLQQNEIPTLEDIKLRDLAKSETEWILVYAYFASQMGTKVFTKENINQLYKETKRNTLNNSKNLFRNFKTILKALYIKSTNGNDFILLPKGIEKVVEILKGNSKGVNRKKSAGGGEATKTRVSNSLKVLTDLNLRPKDKISLKDFAAKYPFKSGDELSLLIVYYLKEELKETVTLNHIYSCMKDLGTKIPQHFKQTLTNQKNNKNWIDVDDWNDIKYTIPGMNHIEQDIMKH